MLVERICAHCGIAFQTKHWKPQRFCTKSCGAHVSKNKRHGLSDTNEHRAWTRIRRRCNSPSYHNFPRYGGRGIKVCARWDLFENFLADMGPRPPGLTLERIDNDGDYEPSNCRWATQAEQNKNKSNVHTDDEDRKISEALAEGLNFTQVAARLGTSIGSVSSRAYRIGLKSGQPVQKITDRPGPPLYRDDETECRTSEHPSQNSPTEAS
jgi:hypothetical protein